MGNERIPNEGYTFYVLYVGSIDVLKSMRDFQFNERIALSKECISKVAESGNRIASRKRKLEKYIKDSVGLKPDLSHAGSNVCFVIKPTGWSVTKLESNEVLFTHLVPMISFASAGDDFAPDFVAYVAKNDTNRRCYVFECCTGSAKQVLAAIEQSFKLRLKISESSPQRDSRSNSESNVVPNATDIPTASSSLSSAASSFSPVTSFKWPLAGSPLSPSVSPKPDNFTFGVVDLPSPLENITVVHQYENDYEMDLDFLLKPVIHTNVEMLQQEPWFFGRLSRVNSESLINLNGQFLVRQSDNDPNVLVLTGMHNGVHQHLSLVDKEGNVRTKDRCFENVCHLIRHHRENKIPIAWLQHWVVLSHPVVR